MLAMTKKNEPRAPLPDPVLEPPPLPPGRFLDCSPIKTAVTIYEVRHGHLASLEEHEAIDKAISSVARPGGDARGKQKTDAADEWRIPSTALAEKIWQAGFLKLSIDIVGRARSREELPEDKQPPSTRALIDHIRPLRPPKR